MRVEFRHGVPKECIAWLWEHVGHGNVVHTPDNSKIRGNYIEERDRWFYERIEKPVAGELFQYVPTITVIDPELALVFALRWQ